MRKLILAVCCIGLLSGCSVSEQEKKNDKATGELRHKLFVECMELAAKNSRSSDDDVHKVVDACSSQSFYMANQIMK